MYVCMYVNPINTHVHTCQYHIEKNHIVNRIKYVCTYICERMCAYITYACVCVRVCIIECYQAVSSFKL